MTPASLNASLAAHDNATGRQHLLHAFLTPDGHWRAEAVLDGEAFVRQCADWDHVERFRDWLQGRAHHRIHITTHARVGDPQ